MTDYQRHLKNPLLGPENSTTITANQGQPNEVKHTTVTSNDTVREFVNEDLVRTYSTHVDGNPNEQVPQQTENRSTKRSRLREARTKKDFVDALTKALKEITNETLFKVGDIVESVTKAKVIIKVKIASRFPKLARANKNAAPEPAEHDPEVIYIIPDNPKLEKFLKKHPKLDAIIVRFLHSTSLFRKTTDVPQSHNADTNKADEGTRAPGSEGPFDAQDEEGAAEANHADAASKSKKKKKHKKDKFVPFPEAEMLQPAPTWNNLNVESWVATTHEVVNQSSVQAFTTRELIELNGKEVDVAPLVYGVPSGTPVLTFTEMQADQTEKASDDKENTKPSTGDKGKGKQAASVDIDDSFNFDESFDDIRTPRRHRKDLTKIFGVPAPFHIVSNEKGTFLADRNLSDYYGIPFFEPVTSTKALEDLAEEKDQTEYDPMNAGLDYDVYDGSYAFVDPTAANIPFRPYSNDDVVTIISRVMPVSSKSIVPGGSLVLYFLGRGHPVDEIVDELVALDDVFVYETHDNLFEGHHIPQHTHLNPKLVAELMVMAKRKPQNEVGPDGRKMNDATKELEHKQRVHRAQLFVRATISSYLAWRFEGSLEQAQTSYNHM